MSILRAASVASRLLDARDTLRRLHGPDWPTRVRPHMDLLQEIAARSGKSVLEIALRAAEVATEKHDGMGALCILAAAVEIEEPTA